MLEVGCWKEKGAKSKNQTLNEGNGGRAAVVSQEGNWVFISLSDPERLTMWRSQLPQGAFTDNLIRLRPSSGLFLITVHG